MELITTTFARAVIYGMIAVGFVEAACAFELITDHEANLPDDDTRGRGISRGPQIIVISPPFAAGMIRSPLSLKIRIEGHGGVKVDADSIVITYRKNPPIDLTQRCRPFITTGGVTVENATVPPGTHTIRVDAKDVEGRSSRLEFSFSVTR